MIGKKKNGFFKAAGLMLAVMALSACVVSGTMAKYTSSGTVNSDELSVQVAKWEIRVTALDSAGDPDTQTLNDSGFSVTIGSLEWVILPNADEGVTAATPADGKIAPGTWGFAKMLTIANIGEVDAIVKIDGLDKFLPDLTDYETDLEFMAVASYQDFYDSDFESTTSSYSDVTDNFTAPTEGLSGGDGEGYRIVKEGDGDPDGDTPYSDTLYLYICYRWGFEVSSDDDETDTEMATPDSSGSTTEITFGSATLTITAEQAQTAKE